MSRQQARKTLLCRDNDINNKVEEIKTTANVYKGRNLGISERAALEFKLLIINAKVVYS